MAVKTDELQKTLKQQNVYRHDADLLIKHANSKKGNHGVELLSGPFYAGTSKKANRILSKFDELRKALSKKQITLNITSVNFKPEDDLIKVAEETGGTYRLLI